MTRIKLADPDKTEGKPRARLEAIRKKLGFVPNVSRALATSPATMEMYHCTVQALGQGALSQRLREKIALAVGQLSGCEYCVAAHSAIARRLRIDDEEVARNLEASSSDPMDHAALRFASQIVKSRGHVSDTDVEQVREAGYTDGQIVELVANVCHNLFTNYVNDVVQTEIDFPVSKPHGDEAA